MNWSQAIGVLAFALNVWGNLELTKVGNRGHIIRLCSNACWLVYSPLVGAWALMLNHATFAGINVLGFHRWKRAEREGRIASPTRLRDAETKALRYEIALQEIQGLCKGGNPLSLIEAVADITLAVGALRPVTVERR